MSHLDALRAIAAHAADLNPFTREVDSDLDAEAGMDGHLARLLQSARDLDSLGFVNLKTATDDQLADLHLPEDADSDLPEDADSDLPDADSDLAARLIAGDRNDEANSTFDTLNNAGAGFDPDDEIADWDLVYSAKNINEVSIYKDGYDAVLVGDAHGLWAVRVSE